MNDKIKVQEEFENLIGELERLKSINELTSINAENSESVISEVQSFAGETEKFVEKIKNDLEKRSDANQKLINELDKAIKKFVENSEEMSQSFDESVASITTELKNTFSEKFIKLDELIKRLDKHLDSISTKMVEPEQLEEYQERILKVENNIKTNDKNFVTSLAEMIIDNNNSVKAKFEKQDQEIKFLKKLLWVVCLLIILGFTTTIFLSV